ncbi:MAG: uroporphyrinogen decarboxylase [Desulfobulbus sp.]|jgi:uroporphyrinogen decarboxylase
MNTTFLKACRGEQTSHVPVWFMRQAGRYLPDYQRVRSKLNFLELCKNPALCTEVTLQPVDIFHFDAAILFSDILVPMEAMGLTLEFHEGHGPVFPEPVQSQQAAEALRIPDPAEDTPFVLETIRLLRRELKVPLIGFAGAPFTLATYVIEGGSSRNFYATKSMMFQRPELYRLILDKITACTSSYLIAQAKAGAQALQLFDSWAGALAPCDYERFALPYVQSILADLRKHTDIPLIYFANHGATLLRHTSGLDADVLGIDWRIPLADAIRQVGPHAVQGNLDPLALFLPKTELEARIAAMLEDGKAARGYIFNLGHGVIPETDPDQVKIAVEAVHRFSSRSKQS